MILGMRMTEANRMFIYRLDRSFELRYPNQIPDCMGLGASLSCDDDGCVCTTIGDFLKTQHAIGAVPITSSSAIVS